MYDLAIATNTSYPAYTSALHRSLRDVAREMNHDVYTLSYQAMQKAQARIDLPDGKELDDTVRGMLALEACRHAEIYGIPLVLSDFRSSTDFRDQFDSALRSRTVNLIDQQGSLVSDARREATYQALSLYNPDAICWTEPEKVFLIGMLPHLRKEIPHDGMLIPNRSLGLFGGSYPYDQFAREVFVNYLIGGDLQQRNLWHFDSKPDFMGGARMFDAKGDLARLMLEYPIPDYLAGDKHTGLYGHLMLLPVETMRRRMPVVSADVGYIHPAIQTSLEFESDPGRIAMYAAKRKLQMDAIVRMYYRDFGEDDEHIEWTLDQLEKRLAFYRDDVELSRKVRRERE